jgi:hypothetical protein
MPKTAALERAAPKTIIEEKKIEETIKNIPEDSFTVLDFVKTLKSIYPEVWENLVKRFGLFGNKRRYTAATYLSNRLDMYSHKPYSIFVAFTNYSEGRFKDYRRITEEERKSFGSPWIAVYKNRVRNKT